MKYISNHSVQKTSKNGIYSTLEVFPCSVPDICLSSIYISDNLCTNKMSNICSLIQICNLHD